MGGVPGLHIRQVVVHLAEAGAAQLAALVDQPEHLHIQRHREDHHIGRQHGGVMVAGLRMHLHHLHPLQPGQGGGGLVQAVEVVADRTHAAHQHQAEEWVVADLGMGGSDQALGGTSCGLSNTRTWKRYWLEGSPQPLVPVDAMAAFGGGWS